MGNNSRRQISNNDSFLGVRTRARTLASQNNLVHDSSSSSYLQLRRRRRRIHYFQPPSPNDDETQRNSELDGQQIVRTTRECNAARDLTNIIDETARLNLMTKTKPAIQEMEEFFSSVECRHQQIFKDKYNFDFENDKPFPGRFEWEKLIA